MGTKIKMTVNAETIVLRDKVAAVTGYKMSKLHELAMDEGMKLLAKKYTEVKR